RARSVAAPAYGEVHAANRRLDGPGFHQKVADFLEKLMQVVGFERIREPFPLEHGLSLFRCQNGYEEKNADALWPGGIVFGVSRRIRLSLGEILKSSENWAADIRKRHIHDHQAPDSAGDLCQGVRGQRDDPDTPTLGIEDVLERALANDVVVDDQDSNF